MDKIVIYQNESDRQENKTEETVLSPKWWMIFKYKLAQTLIDERDGFTLIPALEWDQSAAHLVQHQRAVLYLQGTYSEGIRDIKDDFQFLAWESLKDSHTDPKGIEERNVDEENKNGQVAAKLFGEVKGETKVPRGSQEVSMEMAVG
ncbi:hypothetical protein GQ457_06G027030 [Hibiscus cannabinus]